MNSGSSIRKILVAMDGSEPAWKALDLACDLACNNGAEILCIHTIVDTTLPEELKQFAIAEHMTAPFDYLYYDMILAGLEEEIRSRAKGKGIEHIAWLAPKGDPAEEIILAAEKCDADMIVMGKRGFSSAKYMLLGSVSQKVTHLAPCACVTVG